MSKEFKCEDCNKLYSRKDKLKNHKCIAKMYVHREDYDEVINDLSELDKRYEELYEENKQNYSNYIKYMTMYNALKYKIEHP